MKKNAYNVSMNAIVKGYIESIDQGIKILELIPAEVYTKPANPIFEFSIGSHFRHILDVLTAIKSGFNSGIIDYDIRRRGHVVERDIQEAIKEHCTLKTWVRALNESDLETKIFVKTEVLLSEKKSIEIESVLRRELLFASSHAIHHYAIISAAMKFLGLDVDKKIGYAPSTASFLRETK